MAELVYYSADSELDFRIQDSSNHELYLAFVPKLAELSSQRAMKVS